MDTSHERRQHHRVRAIFDDALALCTPFLDPAQGIAGRPLTHHVAVILREHWPDLTPEEILVMVPALQTAWRLRRTPVGRS